MTRSWRLLPLAFAALLLSGCVLADAIEVAASGPHCESFGIPPGLEKEDLYVLDHYFDWHRIDGMIAVLKPYEESHRPDVLFALGILYVRKAAVSSDDPAYFRRGVRLFRRAAMCGQAAAVSYLSGFYSGGPPFVDIDPELGACLNQAYEGYRSVRALLAGRVWACGVRLEDFPE